VHVVYTDHLVGLVAAAEAAAARLALAPEDRVGALGTAARREIARLSVRLDASPLDDATADRVDAKGPPPAVTLPAATGGGAGSGWARALKLEGLATQDVAAREYANLLDAYDAEPSLAADLFDAPLATLQRLHGLVTQGLVAPEAVGRPRTTDQAVHDGAQGWVVYHPPPPEALPALLDGLAGWLGHGSATMPAVVVAGIVQGRLLEWHPFEAANGRVARAASRLVLRARGVDPQGLAVVERRLAADPAGYYAEIAATIRRRGDLAPWLERYAEAVLAGLRAAARAAGVAPAAAAPDRAVAVLAGLSAGGLTLGAYARQAGVSRETAAADLRALEACGLVALVPGSRGLRYAPAEPATIAPDGS
jgi:Fic family protein